LRVKAQIARYLENPGIKSPRRADALKAHEENKMATRAQIAAARKNIRKAQAARRKKRGGRRRRAAASASANPRKRRYAKRRRVADNRGRYEENRRRRRKARRRPKRRRAAAAAQNENPTTVTLENAWPGQPRRHARAARKGWRKRRHGGGRKRRRTTRAASRRRSSRRRCPPCKYKRTRSGKFAGGLTRREMAMLENPGIGGLLSNPASPYTRENLVRYGTAAAGVAIGLLVADFVDRVVATMKPKDGKNAWYGADAAAAIYRRPDATRLGVQVVGGVVALGLAAWTRGRGIIPWLASGIALGFGSNALLKLANWYLMPAILKVDPAKPMSFANRMYALEQDSVQKAIDASFKAWATVPSLSAGQQGEASQINSPLGDQTTNLAVLGANPQGKAQALTDPAGSVGSGQNPRTFLQTNRLGNCQSCGGKDGCYSDCQSLCPGCGDSYRPYTECTYEVEVGDDLAEIAAAGGVSIDAVSAMNGGTPDTYWVVGNSVRLPYGMCLVVEQRKGGVPAGVPLVPSTPYVPSGTVVTETIAPIPGGPERVLITPPTTTVMTAAGTMAGAAPEKANGQPQQPEKVVARQRPSGTISFWNMDEAPQEV